MKFRAQPLQPPTTALELMFGGLFDPMTQTKNLLSHCHPFWIVVKAKLGTRKIILVIFSVHGQCCF